MTRDIRQRVLEKIASLSAASSRTSFDRSDLDRLCKATQAAGKGVNGYSGKQNSSSLGRCPMTIREFEVLLSLCKAAPAIQTSQSAQKLAHQLIPYVLEAHVQVFVPSPFFRKVEPSPTEALAFHVTAALLSLGSHYDDLHEMISDNVWAFVNACDHAADHTVPPQQDDEDPNLEDAIRTATIAVSLLGFLDAASAQADFWRAGGRLALVQRFRDILSESFLVAVETAFSTIRNSQSSDRHAREWKRYLRHYSAAGRPLGAILLQRSYMWLLVSGTSLLVTDASLLRGTHILDLLMSGDGAFRPGSPRSPDADYRSLDMYTTVAVDQMNYLEAGEDYLKLGSSWQQRLAFAVKSAALISYLNCSLMNEDVADVDVLINWLEETLADPLQMADENLAATVLRSIALVCKISRGYAATASRLLPRFIVQSAPNARTVAVASKSLAFVLQLLSHDAVITTLYTLGNVLSPGSDRSMTNGTNGDLAVDAAATLYPNRHSTGSSISLAITGEEETAMVYGNVVQAICGIATACNDEKITALAQSMLLQKIDKVNSSVDAQIVSGAAALALKGGQLEFRSLLKVFSRICHIGVVGHKDFLLVAVMKARTYISANLHRGSPLYDIYWEHLLESIISMGDVHQSNHTKEADVQLAAREIAELLHPLAVFMSTNDLAFNTITDDESHSMIRDAWFNIVVHGFTTQTDMGKTYLDELRIMAVHSPPLVAEQRGEQIESDIELNTVLRRGMSSDRESLQKRHLTELIPNKAPEIKGLSYRKVIFLHAAYLVESLRADAGDCTKALSYFLEPSMRRGEVSSTMEGIAAAVVDKYLRKTLGGTDATFSAQYAAAQLVAIFCGCCHRIERVQQAAFTCADRIITQVPSALCHRSSLFALLELLSLMWSSCLEAETDLYAPRSKFTSSLGDVSVELSDDYTFRRHTLDVLNRRAKQWVSSVISIAPLDIKGLLQTYLSEFDDEGAYGHISLGRSFAIELGSLMPSTDQRLQSLDRVGDCSINTGSDFVAQYTTRQEYRYGETLPERGNELVNFMQLNRRASFLQSSGSSASDSANAATALAHVEARIKSKKTTALTEVRDILRRAAALLCRSNRDESAVAHYLVSIPFAMFTKQSIKLGVSLWLGVMNENPRLEPRLLTEIAQQWEATIQSGLGLFSHAMSHPDPFFLKEEFAPSDLEALAKRKQQVHNLLSPHMRLLQFFASHFNATRLGSPDVQRVFLRMLDVTLDAVRSSTPHPMARELRFQIVLFGLKVLHVCTTIGAIAQWRFKEKILSAALSWFRYAPRWSFGSNILQLKTELRLLTDIVAALKHVAFIGANAADTIKSLQAKEQLLVFLLESEQTRLSVWVHPLGEPTKAHGQSNKAAIETALAPLIRVAWAEDPSIAIELVTRFPYPRVQREVRWLLINFPQKAISEPEGLPILLGGSLPNDVSFQLKYLLFWSPVNPITAATYFLPAYRNHPFLIQYAMRAMESHSSDVTFFYVPQIVQTLRYDALGYVERYILETAQFSQLFAHQIIWNMKANAYKDDDATIPDAIKPTLDKVMEKMIASFSDVDRTFYEREFAFFDEVTDISGKLKPYVGRPKPEKAQKIEEELRKIKVEIGVYLPSNPDGVVIGIDRKSGKPLQSHAKAPYMATFRIKKNKGSLDDVNDMLEDVHKKDSPPAQENTIEVWQSAIFKVGDDCRQDVLALQMIAAFRGIFHNVGLDVYVNPYRVTATAPGCGVIDVLPNSVSRDMLGREAVNGLYDYFISKYGNEDSLRFQQARSNFVKSMAAYSIISFLLQFKDRHNGNIMIDDAGHILHIDFGFCFDIAPGGIKFERAPFKLTTEMLAVMGGSPHHQAFKWFEELCVKAFLASRQHCEKLSQIVLLMMDSGLPCFKPESVQHFKERFVLERSEREAADFVKDLIRRSANSYSTGVYDQFQLLTNGIPY
ncbi:phosphatidylinositol 3 [Colletotrichum lupini]|uniref:1-phosphatidylinositol 4-kinase n=1 Tax=Colletotrichum lupini TaxID=145971 RepID=A0A9Q8T0F9_9PEZI|nr:phosphatidylinositol 3 [Colletotrichum lupini]KAK1708972.1 phosphatidylinositol 3 [Colletotrichum lupini]UQC86974.1 phosphatidylinositol 3 [Colletotrichum lupini]